MKCDVVVVGMGAAGTAAAVSAAETARARGTPFDIVIVEKAPEQHWGGNSRWTDANMRLQEPEHLAPGFEADLSAFSRGKSDPHIRPFVENIPETIRWVRAQCVEFERRPLDVWPYPPIHHVRGGGGGDSGCAEPRGQTARAGGFLRQLIPRRNREEWLPGRFHQEVRRDLRR